MATLSQIKSAIWSLSLNGGGAIAEGVTAIRQAMMIILRTTKGSDPLRPDFGSNISLYVDQPATNSALIIMAIREALATWEPRVTVSRIVKRIELSELFIDVHFSLTDSTIQDLLTVAIGDAGIVAEVPTRKLILQARIPGNPNSFQYAISLILDSEQVLPAPPETGFSSISDLYAWVQENWLNYGQFYRTGDMIVGYINGVYTNGSMAITVIEVRQFRAIIPIREIGELLQAIVTVNGTTYTSPQLYTAEELRAWLDQNVAVGSWSLGSQAASFSIDFSEDFHTTDDVMVLTSSSVDSITINITAA